ncbi:ribonuclease Y [Patescibacteria group bacterium]
MDLKLFIILVSAGVGLAGIALGYFIRWALSVGKRGSMELEIKQMTLAAKEEAQKITEEADKKASKILSEAEQKEKEKKGEIKKMEDRFLKKEDYLDKRQLDVDSQAEDMKKKIVEIKTLRENAEKIEEEKKVELQKISGLSKEEALVKLNKELEKEYEEDLMVLMQKMENTNAEQLERKARDILTSSIQRLANSTASETMTSNVTLPSDDVKGKIIGKEGRNIRAFERAAGVDVIVDDTPGAITISSFDPVRRQIARVALENLILDGRIQPAKIEDYIAKAREEINKIIKTKGEEAVYECGVYDLDPRIVSILGRLYFRTSYGQNVLQHSIEMSHISGMLAEELGVDVQIAKAGALLHDIGKAVDHEVQGTHVEIGRRILQKFGADEKIILAMQSHHEEYPYETPESIIVQVADAISGGRPGARRDSVENYIKRLQELESIATSFDGVEKSFALQAGREIRVFVHPENISDIEAKNMAKDIAKRVEQELKYPGEIKVHVIRETRVIEYAR